MKKATFLAINLATASLFNYHANAVETDLQELAKDNGCNSCHSVYPAVDTEDKPIAPAFSEIAKRFHKENGDYEYLIYVIKYGSSPYTSRWENKISGLAMPPNKATLSDYAINKMLISILDVKERQD